MRTTPLGRALAAIAAATLVVACSGGEEGSDPGVAPQVTSPGAGTSADDQVDPTTPGPDGAGDGADEAGAADPTTTELVTVPEVGVPGLDSDDVVCRSWSRFGGSFQVLAVAASFGEGGPAGVAELEVLAAPSVTAAYDALLANWPDELAAERDVVADDYLGPFARRSQLALELLVAAGAAPATVDALAAAWEAALANRDPADPSIAVDVPADAAAAVEAAAEQLAAQVVPIPADPDLIVTAQAPLTEAFLAETCPDRGTLGGIEVDTPDVTGDSTG